MSGWGLSRREFMLGVGAGVIGSGLGAGRVWAGNGHEERGPGSQRPGDRKQRVVGVDVSAHPVPFPENLQRIARFDQRWLDAQAVGYWEEYAQHLGRPLDAYDRADFWFRYIALPLQAKAMAGASLDPKKDEIELDLGLMHMVGYYGGVWFFKKLEQFTGADQTAQCQTPVPELGPDDLEPLAGRLEGLVRTAREADDGVALDVAEDLLRDGTLLDQADTASDLPTRRGFIGYYSYNVGYTNAILVPDNRALPPPLNPDGPPIDAPPWNSIVFTPAGVFDCAYPAWADPVTKETTNAIPNPAFDHGQVPYLVGDAPAMAAARLAFAQAQRDFAPGFERVRLGALDRHGQPVALGPLDALALAGFNTGTATWTAPGLLDIRMWDAPSYHLIVALSVYFLQAVQAAGQADMAAAAMQDEGLARNGILTSALALPFGLSYLLGSGQRHNVHYACRLADECVPPLVLADGTRI